MCYLFIAVVSSRIFVNSSTLIPFFVCLKTVPIVFTYDGQGMVVVVFVVVVAASAATVSPLPLPLLLPSLLSSSSIDRRRPPI